MSTDLVCKPTPIHLVALIRLMFTTGVIVNIHGVASLPFKFTHAQTLSLRIKIQAYLTYH
jgi:hypothetical protein